MVVTGVGNGCWRRMLETKYAGDKNMLVTNLVGFALSGANARIEDSTKMTKNGYNDPR